MSENTKALHDFLLENAEKISEEWFTYQVRKPGSDYSTDAPAFLKKKVKLQNIKYVSLMAEALIYTEEDMKKAISEWTNETASERVQSQTAFDEVIKNLGINRRIYWKYIQLFTTTTDLAVTTADLFKWEKKINSALDYVMETFSQVFMKILLSRLSSQAVLIKELSAPVIALSNEIGLLPMVGDIDTARAKLLLESTLEQSLEKQISTLVIDMSGVVLIDTMVAQEFFQLITALQLVGVQTILTGLRPEVVMTAVQLGIDFTSIQTENSLRSVLKNLQVLT